MTAPELKTCPFCGKPARIYGTNVVGCEDQVSCGGQVDWGHHTRVDGPIAAWNRRDPAVLAELPEVKAMLREERIKALQEASDVVDVTDFDCDCEECRVRKVYAKHIRALIAETKTPSE